MAYTLAESVEDVDRFLKYNEPREAAGLDTETTSLDTRRAKLVGTSLSPEPGVGIYIPIGHQKGINVPLAPAIELVSAWFKVRNTISINHNAKFDRNILQVATGWVPDLFEDSIELLYLDDPDRKEKGLKAAVKAEFGFDMAKFESLFSPEEVAAKVFDISTKHPARCLDYACGDADWTLQLWTKFARTRSEFSIAVKVDTALIDVVRKIEHNGGMELNIEYIEEQMTLLEARAKALQDQIFRLAGYRFEIGSPKQLGIALFDKLGIPNQGMTRGRNPIYRTDADVMEKLAYVYPVVEYVISFRKVDKARSTYFAKLQRLHRLKVPVRFSFNMFAAPTFRFAAPGGDPEKDGFTGINIQAVSNGEARTLPAVKLTNPESASSYVSDLEAEELLVEAEHIDATAPEWKGKFQDLAWVVEQERTSDLFCFRETCSTCVAACPTKGLDTTRRPAKDLLVVPSVRQAFRAPRGYSLLSLDYDRQELVIGANLSGEPKWIKALNEGQDLHAITAAAAFGLPVEVFLAMKTTNPEEYKRKRDIAKILNFATFYGATAYTLAMKADIAKKQAEAIFDGMKSNLSTLFGWIDKVHRFARKNGYTTTYFGRRRWLKQFYESADPKMHSFADRSSVNTAIQGTGAEVTRIAMVKVDRALKNAGFKRDDIRFGLQLHDELMFIVRDELVPIVIPIIVPNMAFPVKSWQVQLTCAPKVGRVWGQQKELKSA